MGQIASCSKIKVALRARALSAQVCLHRRQQPDPLCLGFTLEGAGIRDPHGRLWLRLMIEGPGIRVDGPEIHPNSLVGLRLRVREMEVAYLSLIDFCVTQL